MEDETPPARSAESPILWRPWILTARDTELTRNQRLPDSDGDPSCFGSKGALGFQHPVRLYLPRSKRHEYLHSSGEKVLASFPVQATIHFYNDDSDTEDEEDEDEFQPYELGFDSSLHKVENPAENDPTLVSSEEHPSESCLLDKDLSWKSELSPQPVGGVFLGP
ncbi:protein ripply3 isoform X2 [Ornithorhynchus anatinus]|uniref:protein ripply3 isoform X2 n=1 Tax=Ornithorhynchus anatinus TaxID=9258 RepID=UPI0004548EC0|nr:protein ripply3 isoform X2 [Ornithorhynchus anatinus]